MSGLGSGRMGEATTLAEAKQLPIGLERINLSCYMNSTVQFLKSATLLSEQLKKFKGSAFADNEETAITAALRDLISLMDDKLVLKLGKPVSPLCLFRSMVNLFSKLEILKKTESTDFEIQQMDAQECFIKILQAMDTQLKTVEGGNYSSCVQKYFGGKFASEYKSTEECDEAESIKEEDFLCIECRLIETSSGKTDGISKMKNQNNRIFRMPDCILRGYTDRVVENRQSGLRVRNVEYLVTDRVVKLPYYLPIHIVRTFYDEKSQEKLKDESEVEFEEEFDVFPICSKQLQQHLCPNYQSGGLVDEASASNSTENAESDKETSRQEGTKKKALVPYNLLSVICHTGKTLDGGDYTTWARQEDGQWCWFDDNKVYRFTNAQFWERLNGEISRTAYMLLYARATSTEHPHSLCDDNLNLTSVQDSSSDNAPGDVEMYSESELKQFTSSKVSAPVSSNSHILVEEGIEGMDLGITLPGGESKGNFRCEKPTCGRTFAKKDNLYRHLWAKSHGYVPDKNVVRYENGRSTFAVHIKKIRQIQKMKENTSTEKGISRKQTAQSQDEQQENVVTVPASLLDEQQENVVTVPASLLDEQQENVVTVSISCEDNSSESSAPEPQKIGVKGKSTRKKSSAVKGNKRKGRVDPSSSESESSESESESSGDGGEPKVIRCKKCDKQTDTAYLCSRCRCGFCIKHFYPDTHRLNGEACKAVGNWKERPMRNCRVVVEQIAEEQVKEWSKSGQGGSKKQPDSASGSRADQSPSSSTIKRPKMATTELEDSDKHLDKLIRDQILQDTSEITWDNIKGQEEAKNMLKLIVVHPHKNPDLFQGILMAPATGVLLFGCPGTGKTMFGKAVAHECNAHFFNISAADLMSKWIGEGEKIVRKLFSLAREMKPSVIFIDEVDSLLSQRSEGQHEAHKNLVNEFLLQFDGMRKEEGERILVLGTTNRPQDLDDAARRRFSKRVYITLPNCEGRFEIIKDLLERQGRPMPDKDIHRIAENTDKLSGSDLKDLAKKAATIRLEGLSTQQLHTFKEKDLREITIDDFSTAMANFRSSVDHAKIPLMEKWNTMYGSI